MKDRRKWLATMRMRTTSMISALNSALGGLARSTAGVNVAAHNIANLNTDGFRAQRLDSAGNVRPRNEAPPPEVADRSDVDLAEELIDMKVHEHGFKANINVLKAADRMNGELLDLLA